MLPAIKKILYATDLSANARYAFDHAASIANKYSATITALYVLKDLPPDSQFRVEAALGKEKWNEIRDQAELDLLRDIRSRLDHFCEERQGEVDDCPFIVDEIIVIPGEPATRILDICDKKNFDLIVIGAHGHGRMAGAMLGSTVRRVIRRAAVPTMIVRMPEEA